MYEALKRAVLAILKVPAEPPEEPAGTHESVQVFRASPRFLTYLLLQYGIGMVILATALMGAASAAAVLFWSQGMAWLAVVIWSLAAVVMLVKAAVFYVTTRLNYEMRWYIVTDRSLRIREGVFFMREVTLTFANVQNISTTQGPLQRYFGIADVIVETAGGGTGAAHGAEGMMLAHHGVLRGIENAAEVRDRIQSLLRAYRAAGLGDPEDRNAPARAASMPDALVEALRGVREECGRLKTLLAG